ncbi:hypothetical protein TWF106_010578 [Orbilia oligospora]|uniref:Uncharacterized protein n=1 Tax=Orbilia oligospora TaxID=2813651 RepID=A0A7C8QWK1_ORBOL|nr:hypothetical protein TWF788_000286 [Orbilia oligospora]KAF3227090.1 hypothetical protein TWF106_010578 [Orbilia oligospora]
MCWLSVQCSCKHNIAIAHPTKSCVRPRNPRGCWIIRRGEPLKKSCPGCEEYLTPGSEQPSWRDVKRCHNDPAMDWAEVNHYDIITMDKNRHRVCDNERLEFRKRLRWKTMIANGMVTGWSLNNRGVAIVDPSPEEIGNEGMDYYQQHEVIEPFDPADIDNMLLDPGEEKNGNEDGIDGYMLERVSSRPRLARTIYTTGNGQEFESLFSVFDNSEGDISSNSDNSNEAVMGSDESTNTLTENDSGKEGEYEPLMKLDEMFDHVEASKPFDLSSSLLNSDIPVWAPATSDSPIGDPIKKPLPKGTPIKLEIKKEPDTAPNPVTAISGLAPLLAVTSSEGTTSNYREGIDQALARLRRLSAARMSAAYTEARNARFPDLAPITPVEDIFQEETPEEDSEEGGVTFQFN